MIKYLSIQNYTLIESLALDFDNGITIITGETGAGKSILIGALSLVLGQRADTNALFDKSKKCVVEGHFDISHYNLESFFLDNELDYEDTTIVRREITPNNRTRAFINDTPVSTNLLKDFASALIDIHSQHDALSLNRSDYQLAVIDDFSGNALNLEQYRNLFLSFSKHKKALEELMEREKKSKADLDYFSFLYNELSACNLVEGEQDDAEKELALLNNAEDIKRNLNIILQKLNYSEINVIGSLKDITATIEGLQKYLPEFDELFKRTQSVYIELKDIFSVLFKTEENIVYSTERIDEINDRLNIIYELQKKHRVNSVEELKLIIDDLSDKLLLISSLETEIETLEKNIEQEKKELTTLSQIISGNRKKHIPIVKEKITKLLHELLMPDAVFEIPLVSNLPFRSDGTDTISFLFSANKGTLPDEISKVASGGELSRLMLAIKSVVSANKLLPTLIFDEIDTGISGETAVKTANIINKMGHNMQIIAITHLPQIACLGKNHFVVYKTVKGEKTITSITKLSSEERVKAIAGMISGHHLTEASISTAKELLEKF